MNCFVFGDLVCHVAIVATTVYIFAHSAPLVNCGTRGRAIWCKRKPPWRPVLLHKCFKENNDFSLRFGFLRHLALSLQLMSQQTARLDPLSKLAFAIPILMPGRPLLRTCYFPFRAHKYCFVFFQTVDMSKILLGGFLKYIYCEILTRNFKKVPLIL